MRQWILQFLGMMGICVLQFGAHIGLAATDTTSSIDLSVIYSGSFTSGQEIEKKDLNFAKGLLGIDLYTSYQVKEDNGIPMLHHVAATAFDIKLKHPKNENELHTLKLSRFGALDLPIAVEHVPFLQSIEWGNQSVFINQLSFEESGIRCELVLYGVTENFQAVPFIGSDIFITYEHPQVCGSQFWLEQDVNVHDPEFPITIKGSMDLDSASYVAFNCDGFDKFQLICEYRFPRSMLIPIDPTQQRVRALFMISSVKIGDFIGSVRVDPFEIVGLDDVQFVLEEAAVDFSVAANHPPMLQAISDGWPQLVRNRYTDPTWRGFFLSRFSISLPEGMAGNNGGRFTINVEDLIADHGYGVSGRLVVAPNLMGGIAGWGIGIDSLLLQVVTNSVEEFRLKGRINIPIMEGTYQYLAHFQAGTPGTDEKTSINLTLTLDGTYTMPFLSNSSLVLHSGSSAGIRYEDGKFEPHAILHGSIQLSISNPSIQFPTLDFQDFRINDRTVAAASNVPSSGVTGGLDRISVGSFGIGGISFPAGGGASGNNSSSFSGGGASDGGSSNTGGSSTGGASSGNQTLAGFPLTIKNIGFGSTTDDGQSCYSLNFTIGVNFASGVNAFQSNGSFSILGKIDFGKLISSRPWEAIDYHKTLVNSIEVEADFGKVSIYGGIRLINNDPIYGSGFKGGIKMDVKLPASEFFVHCVGQFGNIPGSGNQLPYRYFFVDAEAGFNPGLLLGTTGLAIYGFSGGFFYNMERAPGGPSPAEIAASKNPQSMPTNQPASMTSNLLTPGVTLSGIQYVPRRDVTSFEVGLIFGLARAETFLADVNFGMQFNTANGWAVERISFRGGAYVMNPGVAQRSQGAIVVNVDLVIDLVNEELVGKFGMSVTVPFGSPPSIALIVGSYNTNLTATNVYFKFRGNREYFFYAGTPQDPMNIDFQLTNNLRLGNLRAYFMVGTQLPGIPSIGEIFATEGYTLPASMPNVNRGFMGNGGGVAFGARLRIPNQSYSFLMFSATLRAMAGFDASLTYFANAPGCGSNGTFGMNNWYIQGQAYAAFYGALNMDIDVFFYKGRVKIAELEAGVGLMAQLPNPTYMMGFVYGRYRVLGGRIKGSFNFKLETGTRCAGLPAYNPVASIPLIQDVKPENNSDAEVYDSPIVTFFVPMDQFFTFEVPLEDGSMELRTYQCYLDMSNTRLNRRNSWINIPFDLIPSDSSNTLIFQTRTLLQPNTDYTFRVRARWREWRGAVQVFNPHFEERIVHFRTGDRPNRIVSQALGYHAPGLNQRYWMRNYARPMLEFKQDGWEHLFPPKKKLFFVINDPQIVSAFQGLGWDVEPELAPGVVLVPQFFSIGTMRFVIMVPSTQMLPTGRVGISKEVNMAYTVQLTNLQDNSVQEIPINDHPGANVNFEIATIQQSGVADGFSNLFTVNYVATQTSLGRQVRFDALNNLNLAQGAIYAAKVIRKPAESIQIPPLSTFVQDSTSVSLEDGTTVFTQTVSRVELSPAALFRNQLLQAIADEVLYDNYHFAISRYNSLREKVNGLVSTGMHLGIPRSDFGHPSASLLSVRWTHSTRDVYHMFSNSLEPFDFYDEISLRNNLRRRFDSGFVNPLKNHLYFSRRPRDLVGLSGTTQIAGISQVVNNPANQVLERDLTRSHVVYDLYFPYAAWAGRRLSNQSGVTITNEQNRPSVWYEIGNRTMNSTSASTRIAYMHYFNFVRTITEDYDQIPNWATQLHFQGSFPKLLTASEIQNRSLLSWNGGHQASHYRVDGLSFMVPGSQVLLIQDVQPRINRNISQLYTYHGLFLFYLSDRPNLTICLEHNLPYILMRWYYTRNLQVTQSGSSTFYSNHTWPTVWQETMSAHGQQLTSQQLGFRFFHHLSPPAYMSSRGIITTTSISLPNLFFAY
jgi:hypothetical protein